MQRRTAASQYASHHMRVSVEMLRRQTCGLGSKPSRNCVVGTGLAAAQGLDGGSGGGAPTGGAARRPHRNCCVPVRLNAVARAQKKASKPAKRPQGLRARWPRGSPMPPAPRLESATSRVAKPHDMQSPI